MGFHTRLCANEASPSQPCARYCCSYDLSRTGCIKRVQPATMSGERRMFRRVMEGLAREVYNEDVMD